MLSGAVSLFGFAYHVFRYHVKAMIAIAIRIVQIGVLYVIAFTLVSVITCHTVVVKFASVSHHSV